MTRKSKDEALALIASGVKSQCVGAARNPKSTLSDWVHTQNESDEDGVAARREIRRKQIARCEKIGGQGAACARPQGRGRCEGNPDHQ